MEGCCENTEHEPAKPDAQIDLPKGSAAPNVKPGDEVTVVLKGKVTYVALGESWKGDEKYENRMGSMKLEVLSVKITTDKNEFSELAEDD